MDNRDDKNLISLVGYNSFQKDRTGRRGGGVLTYVKSCYSVIQDNVICNGKEIEALCLELNSKKRSNIKLGLVYRPPNHPRGLDNELNNFIKEVAAHQDCVILGDFNYPDINWETSIGHEENTEFLETIADSYLTQLVEDPTRGDNILDLVFTSDDNLVENLAVGEHFGDSDHNIIRFDIITSSKIKENNVFIPNFNRANFEEIRNKLREVNWSDILLNLDTDDKWKLLKKNLLEIIDKFVPKKKIRSNCRPQPKWFNREISSKIGEKTGI